MGIGALSVAIHLGSTQKERTKMPISQFLLGSGLTADFLSSCLTVHLLISLRLGADCDPLLLDIGRSWHTLNY